MAPVNLIVFIYPTIIIPSVCCLVFFAASTTRTRSFGILVAMAVLIPESLIIIYRDAVESIPLGFFDFWDAMGTVGIFAALACVAGAVAPSILRRFTRASRNEPLSLK